MVGEVERVNEFQHLRKSSPDRAQVSMPCNEGSQMAHVICVCACRFVHICNARLYILIIMIYPPNPINTRAWWGHGDGADNPNTRSNAVVYNLSWKLQRAMTNFFKLVNLSNPHDKLKLNLSSHKKPHDKFKLNLSICHGNYKEQ